MGSDRPDRVSPPRTPLASIPPTRVQRTVSVTATGMLAAGLVGFIAFRHHGRFDVLAVVLEGLGVAGQILFVALRVRQRRRLERQ